MTLPVACQAAPPSRSVTLALILATAGQLVGEPGKGGALPEPATKLFDGLGNHFRPVATSRPEAQKYFDQGLAFLYAYNHDETIRGFRRAAEIDPD